MSIEISVRDYRGVERADIHLDPIALVAGRNEAGKSSLAEAVRAVLTGTGVPISGVNKKDAKLLVRDGSDSGHAKVSNGNEVRIVEWPKAKVTADSSGAPFASPVAAGLYHPFDLDTRERANLLAEYIDSAPTEKDLAEAMADIGYGEEAAWQTWQAIKADGWDATHKKAKEHTARLKGRWEGVTGEKYGSKKAAEWKPEGYPEQAMRPPLEEAVDQARMNLDRVIGQRAVAQVDVQKLREKAESIPTLEEQEQQAAKARQECARELEEIKKTPRPEIPVAPTLCPSCNTPLSLDPSGMTLVIATEAPTEEEIEEAQLARDEYDDALTSAQDAFTAAANAHSVIENRLNEARQAAAKLEEIEEQDDGAATEADVEAARSRLNEAEAALEAYDAKVEADRLHAKIAKNEKLIDVLAPDGLRRRKLAAQLEEFNDWLAGLCKAAEWPLVRIDENLNTHYGTRPLWAASASAQWRARAVVQVVMAKLDGSVAVVLDEADILDSRGRNGLIQMIQGARIAALICMTANKPELVPDLAAAGLGGSWWIDEGVAREIATKEVA